MNKQQWIDTLESEVEELQNKSIEVAQDKMIKLFQAREMERMDCFNHDEDVGSKYEMENLFNRYQGNYAYETNSNFTTMEIFEAHTTSWDGVTLKTVCFGKTASPTYEIVFDDGGEDRAGVKAAMLGVDSKDRITQRSVKVDGNGKVRADEGKYIMVRLGSKGGCWHGGSFIKHKCFLLMQIDASGHDSHRYSVEIDFEGFIVKKKLPNGMLLGVFDSEEALLEDARTRMSIGG